MMAGMVRALLISLLAMAFPAMALADVPTTRPTVKVAVVPFEVLGETGHEWMGRAMQEGLATGLQKTRGVSAVIVPGIAPADADAAVAMGKSVNADAVIFGSIQMLDGQMRVGGQITSLKSARVIGVLQSDGSEHGLFDIEDMLSDRAGRLLRPEKQEKPSAPAPTFQLVGPSVAAGPPSYFDGDISEVISRRPRFRDDYDRYYYHSADTAGWGACCGAPFPGGTVFGAGCGPAVSSVAAPLSTW
jgi:TolB-like protein